MAHSHPAVNQAELDALALHEAKTYPVMEGGVVVCYKTVQKVPNGWLYGEEFVPADLCCADCGDPLAEDVALGE